MKRGWRLGRNEADTTSCVELDRRFGRVPSLTPGRVESSAFIPDPESAPENRSQSEPERLREGLEGLVPGAAGRWVGMTTAPPPSASQGSAWGRNARQDQKEGGGGSRSGPPPFWPEPAGTRRRVASQAVHPRVRRGARTERQDPEGLRARPQPYGAPRTC